MARRSNEYVELEALLGHTFRKPELLRLALTHRSFVYDAGGGTGRAIRRIRPRIMSSLNF